MSHGTNRGPYFMPKPRWRDRPPLDAARFDGYLRIAAELGFRSISYDDLAAWRSGDASLPERPIMFDFDHPNRSIGREIWPVMRRHGFTGKSLHQHRVDGQAGRRPLPDVGRDP
jgi:hypothetical protein